MRVLGTVAAGWPSPAEEELLDTMSLEEFLIGRPESTYMLKVQGDSMVDAGIMPGDMVLVERGVKEKDGDIVIAEVDGEWTMKHYRKRGRKVCLEAANRKYKPIFPKQELRIAAVEELRRLTSEIDPAIPHIARIVHPPPPRRPDEEEGRRLAPVASGEDTGARIAEKRDLAPDEVLGYVVHRLSVAGSSSRVEFDDAAVLRLHQLSGGVPRTINMLCDRALTLGCTLSASVIDARLVETAADELGVTPPAARSRDVVRGVVLGFALFALGLVGAAGALWVFRAQVARATVQWTQVPQPPGAPVRHLPVPLMPIPAPNGPTTFAAQPR